MSNVRRMIQARPATADDDAAIRQLTRIAWQEPDADTAPIPADELASWFVVEAADGTVVACAAGERQGSLSHLWLIRAVEGERRELFALSALNELTDLHQSEGALQQRYSAPVDAIGAEWVPPLLGRLGFVEQRRSGSGAFETINLMRRLGRAPTRDHREDC